MSNTRTRPNNESAIIPGTPKPSRVDSFLRRPRSLMVLTVVGLLALALPLAMAAPQGPSPEGPSSPMVTLTVSPAQITVGETANFYVNASGFLGPLTFAWAGLPTGCSAANVSTLSCTPTNAGNFTITATATNATGISGSASAHLLVLSSGTASLTVTLTASPSTVTLGQSLLLSANASGVVGPFSYQYSGVPGCSSQNTSQLTCTPSQVGAFAATVSVTSAAGQAGSASTTVLVVASANGTLVVSLEAIPSSFQLGGSTWLNTTVSGAPVTGLSYAYTLPGGCISENVSDLHCTPDVHGLFIAGVIVTTPSGITGSANATLDILLNGTFAVTLNVNPSVITLGDATNLTVTTTGTAPIELVTYLGLPSGCAGANWTWVVCVPTVVGAYTIVANVEEQGVTEASLGVSLVVDAASITNAISITATPTVGEGPLTVSFGLDVTGVLSSTNVSWDFGDGSSMALGIAVQHVYAAPGTAAGASATYTAVAEATFLGGAKLSADVQIQVYANASVGSQNLTVALSATPTQGPAPLAVTFDALVTGGTGSDVYVWSFGDSTNASGTSVETHSYTALGVYTAWVLVTDSAGAAALASTTVNVTDAGTTNVTSALHVSVSIVNAVGTAPLKATFQAVVSGGTGPYALTWNWEDGTTSTVTSTGVSVEEHTYAKGGDYSPELVVTDASHHSTSWDVSSAGHGLPLVKVSSSSSSPAPSYSWWIVAVVCVAILGTFVVLMNERGRRRRAQSLSASTPGAAGAPGPAPPSPPSPGKSPANGTNGSTNGSDPLGYSW